MGGVRPAIVAPPSVCLLSIAQIAFDHDEHLRFNRGGGKRNGQVLELLFLNKRQAYCAVRYSDNRHALSILLGNASG